MNDTEISEKILAIAESAGLSADEVRELLNGGGEIPDALKEVLERVGDESSESCSGG
ncbi:hypothetical protein [Desulfovibrio sp. JC010]|uniref:hypothetical protein n=1 Tax=Desulfovibrio sp. JC010 TaxID=2593641 RepID=UPI0013D134A1|nr:hypothetical protein [Desulfovibrio sp. JC010]